MPGTIRIAVATAIAVLLATTTVAAQNGPSPRVRAAIMAIEGMIESRDDAALQTFSRDALAETYRARFRGDSLLAHLRAIRSAVGEIGGSLVRRDSVAFYLDISGARATTVRFTLDEPGKITSLEVLPPRGRQSPGASASWSDVTWETLPSALASAEREGFNGGMIVRRNGNAALRTVVGRTNPATGAPMAIETIYCIGSQPMDFTMTAILLLAQRGRLSLDDSIAKFLGDVPADKRAITVRHLLGGRSGLLDFYHDSTDWDHDLAWVSRDDAVRRMMASRLRFAPGSARGASHAAYNLLAVIIEKASGASYPEFLRREILTPLGMTRTGFYGESFGLPVTAFAVGGGPSSVGVPNIPPNWGPTSWLVMGSGGMVSTLEDMDRYYTALAEGKLLTGEWARMQQGPTATAGGSDRGYYIQYTRDGRGTSILFLTNSGRYARQSGMAGALERLVLGAR